MSSHRIIIYPRNSNSVSHVVNSGILKPYNALKSECYYYHAIKHALFHANDGIINCRKYYFLHWSWDLKFSAPRRLLILYKIIRCARNTFLIYFKFRWHQNLVFIDLFIFARDSEIVKNIRYIHNEF